MVAGRLCPMRATQSRPQGAARWSAPPAGATYAVLDVFIVLALLVILGTKTRDAPGPSSVRLPAVDENVAEDDATTPLLAAEVSACACMQTKVAGQSVLVPAAGWAPQCALGCLCHTHICYRPWPPG